MLKIFKLLAITIVLITFFYLLGFEFYSNIYLQAGVLTAILILNIVRDSISATWHLLKLLIPFTLTLFIFGLIFQFLKLQGKTDWLYDSMIKVIFFPSSFIFSKLAVSLFTYKDILGLPLKPSTKLEIIFMQTFFRKAFSVMPRLDFYAKMHPASQNSRGFKRSFLTFCTFPLSLYIYLIEEGQILRDYYENRLFILEDK